MILSCGDAVFFGIGPGFGRDQPGIRDIEAKPDHGAVGRVFLHTLEGKGIVEQICTIQEGSLLKPLAGIVMPVSQPVDDQVITGRSL